MLTLNTIRKQPGSTKNRKRLGRGSSSGTGQTSGKGHKGQKARSGGTIQRGFEGGQTPVYRRLPKKGFTNIHARTQAILNLSDLERLDSSLSEVSLGSLQELGMVKGRYDRLVVLGNGEITRSIKIKANRVSDSARQKIEKAGGTIELIEIPLVRESQKR